MNPSGGNGLEACSEEDIGRLNFSRSDSQEPAELSKCGEDRHGRCQDAAAGALTSRLDLSGGTVREPVPFVAGDLPRDRRRAVGDHHQARGPRGSRCLFWSGYGYLRRKSRATDRRYLGEILLGRQGRFEDGLELWKLRNGCAADPVVAPQAPDVRPTDSFRVDGTPGGKPCPSTDAEAPAEAHLVAGTLDPQAGSYSPLVFKASRDDGCSR